MSKNERQKAALLRNSCTNSYVKQAFYLERFARGLAQMNADKGHGWNKISRIHISCQFPHDERNSICPEWDETDDND
jgi:hypothetical protein